MQREQLEHAIRTACQITGTQRVIIVGSQSILGTYLEEQLPPEATMSMEVDVLPEGATDAEIEQLADKVEGIAGEMSMFHQTHGFYIDGVDLSTCILPAGWRERLVEVRNANTAAPGTNGLMFTGLCLDKEDLCVAKLCALREKDMNFVRALLDAGIVDAEVIAGRLRTVENGRVARRAQEWLRSTTNGKAASMLPGFQASSRVSNRRPID